MASPLASARKRKYEEKELVDSVAEQQAKKSRKEDRQGSGNELIQLLDFSALTTQSSIVNQSEELARALLHEHCLSLTAHGTETEFEILELEFYLQKVDIHEDPFTHGSDEQKRSGRWYFHRAPRRSTDSHQTPTPTAAGGYRGGTRKGLDLTLGGPVRSPHFLKSSNDQPSSLLRGGVLLRTLRRLSDSKVISGPSLLVDEILRLSNASNISELVGQKWGGDTTAFPSASSDSRPSSLCIRRRTAPPSEGDLPLYRSPRIGLDLSHPGTTDTVTHPRVVYVGKLYRYFTHPHLLTSNGRSHTFLGVYRACIDSGRFGGKDDVRLIEELAKLSGIKQQTVTKYLADYKSGHAKGSLQAFIGAAGKGASASPSTHLRMMGTIDRIHADHGQGKELNCRVAKTTMQ